MTKANSSTKKPHVKDTETFIEAARILHGETYDYSHAEYRHSHTKVTIICYKHGPFEQKPKTHLDGAGCPKCARERINAAAEQRRLKAARDFVAKAQAMPEHKGKYNYNLVEYGTSRTKVTIICHEHGPFEQTPSSHLNGKGCPKCAQELTNGWSRSDYIKYAKTRNKGRALLYVIKCQDDNETFYKIGITARSVESRFSRPSTMPYDFEVIKTITGDASDIYDMETQFHRMNREKHYTPQKPFGGSVLECFSEITDDARFLLDVI